VAVRAHALIVLRVLVEIFLLPFRLAAGITGLILTIGARSARSHGRSSS